MTSDINGTVVAIQGTAISSTAPTDGQVLTYVSADGKWEAVTPPSSLPPSGSAGGDLGGTYPNPSVINIHGASVPASGSLTTGNVLQVTGGSALSYAAVNLAGGSNFVTGTLPTGNQANQSMGGDVSGTTASATVTKLQGRSVVSTAPTNGQVLTWVNGNSDWEPKTPSGISAIPYAWSTFGSGGSTGTSTTFADLSSTTITTTSTGVIQAIGQLTFYGNGNAGTSVGIRMVIDSQNGPEMQQYENSGGSSSFPTSVTANFISTSLAAGTYTIKIQWRNAAGTQNVNANNGSISAISLPQ